MVGVVSGGAQASVDQPNPILSTFTRITLASALILLIISLHGNSDADGFGIGINRAFRTVSLSSHGLKGNTIAGLEEHAIIVLGQKLLSDGSMSPSNTARVDTAIVELYRSALSVRDVPNRQYLIFSGGDTAKMGRTEAVAMQEHALNTMMLDQHDVEQTIVMLEEDSLDTFQNAIFCKEILHRHPTIANVTVVTSEFHVPRSRMTFEHVFQSTNINITSLSGQVNSHRTILSSERLRDVNLKFLASSSERNTSAACRAWEGRPNDPNHWNLCELLDYELFLFRIFGKITMKNGLPSVAIPRIQQAETEIAVILKTFGLNSTNDSIEKIESVTRGWSNETTSRGDGGTEIGVGGGGG